MKKVLKFIIPCIVILLIIMSIVILDKNASNSKKEPVNFYVFYRETCPFCKELHEYLNELKEDSNFKNKFNIVDYEINNVENNNLMYDVIKHFNISAKGVPFYVVGDKYFFGFSKIKDNDIKNAINSQYDNKNYVDIVNYIRNDLDIVKKENKNISGIIVVIVLIGIIGIIVIGSFVSNKKKAL